MRSRMTRQLYDISKSKTIVWRYWCGTCAVPYGSDLDDFQNKWNLSDKGVCARCYGSGCGKCRNSDGGILGVVKRHLKDLSKIQRRILHFFRLYNDSDNLLISTSDVTQPSFGYQCIIYNSKELLKRKLKLAEPVNLCDCHFSLNGCFQDYYSVSCSSERCFFLEAAGSECYRVSDKILEYDSFSSLFPVTNEVFYKKIVGSLVIDDRGLDNGFTTFVSDVSQLYGLDVEDSVYRDTLMNKHISNHVQVSEILSVAQKIEKMDADFNYFET